MPQTMSASKYILRSRLTLTGRHVLSRQVDEMDPTEMVPPMEFKSAMEMLHWALANGVFKNERYINSSPRTPGEIRSWAGNPDPHRAYRMTGDWPDWHITNEVYDAMVSAAVRYKQLVHYFREVEPEWTYVRTVDYADNSTEVHEINKYGQKRSRMTVPPHGDLCF